jgi:hypothetical protein
MDIHLQGMSLNDPVPYQPTQKFTEFVQVEDPEDDEDNQLPNRVKYSVILQEEEYESEEEDFFSSPIINGRCS